ncbi:uncharacterized protein TrAFT101_006550 [Trichoderma asperellum]|uniref:uncharacterized protein n=1 Tax=Trichoderma asperellum TaxID=101201 RepID=UPI003323D068|nr:hypothetical protein TrAFT101_006550 [Trichoderma asperellum]
MKRRVSPNAVPVYFARGHGYGVNTAVPPTLTAPSTQSKHGRLVVCGVEFEISRWVPVKHRMAPKQHKASPTPFAA